MKRLCRAVRAHTGLACLALLAVLMLSVVLGISLGPVTIPFPEVWRVMLHRLLTPLGLGDWISLEGIRDSTQNIVWPSAWSRRLRWVGNQMTRSSLWYL